MQPPGLGRVLPEGGRERTCLGPQACTHSLTALKAWRGAGDPTGSLDKGNEGSGEPRPRGRPHMPGELLTEGSVPVTLAGPSSRHRTLASTWPPQVHRRAQAWAPTPVQVPQRCSIAAEATAGSWPGLVLLREGACCRALSHTTHLD